MIPEREREALMRLTMCARNECDMCKYRPYIPKKCYERATDAMNILADALRAEQTEPNCSEKPNNCEDLQDWKDRMWAEAIVTKPTISKMEQVDEPQYDTDKGTIKCDNCSENGSYKCSKCDGEMYFKRLAVEDEPQTNADQHVQHVGSVETMQTEREGE